MATAERVADNTYRLTLNRSEAAAVAVLTGACPVGGNRYAGAVYQELNGIGLNVIDDPVCRRHRDALNLHDLVSIDFRHPEPDTVEPLRDLPCPGDTVYLVDENDGKLMTGNRRVVAAVDTGRDTGRPAIRLDGDPDQWFVQDPRTGVFRMDDVRARLTRG